MELSVVLQQTSEDPGDIASRAAALGPVLDALGIDFEWIALGNRKGLPDQKLSGPAPVRRVDTSDKSFGEALLAGFAASSGAFILTTVGATEAADVTALWNKRGDADMVIGAPAAARGLFRRAVNKLHEKTLALPYRDYVSGLRLYRREVLARLQPNAGGVDIFTELTVLMHVEGYKIREVTTRGPSAAPGSGFFSFAGAIPRLRALRRKRDAADADDRAFQSRAPLSKSWVRKRHETVIRFLEVDVPFLDIGGGASRVVQTLSRGIALGQQPRRLRYLRYRAPAVVAGDAHRLPFRDQSFPQLVCVASSHGAAGGGPSFDEIRRVLRPGGTLVVGARESSSWSAVLFRALQGWIGPDEDHAKAYTSTEASVRQTLEENGFAVDELSRVCGVEMIFRAIRKS